MPQDEHPPLGKAFIMAYDGLDRAYPIVARGMDPMGPGYALPAMDSALPEQVVGGIATTAHVFIEVRPTDSDRRVLWNYRLLPGPWIPSRDYDPLIGPVQVRRRSVRSSGQASSLSATGSLTYESEAGSDAVLIETERIWSNGTGGAGNNAYPIRTDDTREDARGPVQTVRQAVVATGSEVGSLTITNGVATHIEYKALPQFAPYLLDKITETWAVPALSLTSTTLEKDGTVTFETRVMELTSSIVSSEAFGNGTWTRITKEAITDTISWKVTRTTAAPGTPIVATEPDEDGMIKTTTRTFTNLASITAAETAADNVWTMNSSEPVTATMGWKVVVTRAYPGNTLTTRRVDKKLNVIINEARTFDVISNITCGADITDTNLIVTEQENPRQLVATKVVTTTPQPAANSLGTAIVSSKTMPFQFPARIDLGLLSLYGTALGHQQPSARLVLATVKTYWVVSATQPTLTFDAILPDTIWFQGVKYTDVLHDFVVQLYGVTPVTFPATTPSNTDYVASWIGQQKLIDGSVRPLLYNKLWEVEAIYLTMR